MVGKLEGIISFDRPNIKRRMITLSQLLRFWTYPSSGILRTREHNVSGTESVSVLR
jgi:hypothetical protein